MGSHLTKLLLSKGHGVVLLSRKGGEREGIRLFEWNPEAGTIDEAAFEGVTKIVHLAGSGIADHRWTKAYKEQIIQSRVLSSRLLIDTIGRLRLKPEVFVSTSATGIYGDQLQGVVDEFAKPGNTFLAKVCQTWEQTLEPLNQMAIRTVILRLGVVLGRNGGFIPRVSAPIKWGVGAALGKGQQRMSWVHLADVCRMYEWALTFRDMKGVYNAVAPEPVSNLEMTRQMAKRLNRPLLLPHVPEFVLRACFGEISDSLLADQPVKPLRLAEINFDYLFPTLDMALDDLL